MTNYQKVRTTQPQSVKHSSEPYGHGAEPGSRVPEVSKAGAPRGSDANTDELVNNYNQFQQRMKEMKLRAQHLQDMQTMKAMGVGVGSARNNSQNPSGPGDRA